MRFLLHRYGFCVTIFIGVNTPIKGGDMYLDFLVNIPNSPGKITYRRKNGVDYVYYEYDRIYNPETQKTNPKRVTIGKRSGEDRRLMQPNQNFLKFFPDAELPEEKDRTVRSSCLRIGDYVVIRKILEGYGEKASVIGKVTSQEGVNIILK